MKTSAQGLLTRSARILQISDDEHGPGYAYSLTQLLEHMKELAERYRAGDTAVVEEFIDVYDIAPKPKQP